MDMLERLRIFIDEHNLFGTEGARILLAVSGGKDSMLMLRLFHDLGIPIEVAHCNFTLRGEESDADESLVQSYCKSLDIPLHIRHFDTQRYATEHRMSIQMAARELRYRWFEDLATDLHCTAIAIAQHKNDHVETVLLNMARGTGLQGLRGILPKRVHIIRPLLFLDAQEIAQTVVSLGIPYRDDASNFSTKYARNKIRLDIIPEFEKLNPDFIRIMDENIARFQETYRVLQDFVHTLRQSMFVRQGPEQWSIPKADIQSKQLDVLYLLFEPFGFQKPVLQDLKDSLDHEAGRVFEAPLYELLLDRDVLILRLRQTVPEQLTVHETQQALTWGSETFSLSQSADTHIVDDPLIAKLDADKVVFPLEVRTWREGDHFQPLGMQGTKKLSDFFTGRKINLFDKKNIPIWVNGNGDILWVSGLRIDDRYKIAKNTQKVLTLVWHK